MNTDHNVIISKQRKIARAGFFWNAAYAGLNAIQAAVILFAVSRTQDIQIAGIITIGFTIGNLMAIIAQYGMRNYQVTDVREEFCFTDYFWCRILTAAGTVLFSVLFLVFMVFSDRYSPEKALIVLEIVLLKIIGAVEEVFVSRLQQQGRLDIGARIAACRLGASITVVFITIWIIPSIPICLLLGAITEIVMDVILVPKGKKYTSFQIRSISKTAEKKLLKIGIPLCVGMALFNYAGNAPKYLVDFFLTDELQAICGYVMMPMFVLTVLNTFVMQPAVKGLGDAWAKDPNYFWQKVRKHIVLLLILSIIVLAGGLLLGLPILSVMYKTDLNLYRSEFLLLMAGGGLYTVSAYLIVLLTTMRRQSGIVLGCVVALLVYLVAGRTITNDMGFKGACILYIIADMAMLIIYMFILIRGRNKKTTEEVTLCVK